MSDSIHAAPEVRELLSDEQLEAVDLQAAGGEAPCMHCGEAIDPSLGPAEVLLLVDSGRRRAAVRLSHGGCGMSAVVEAEIEEPSPARLAERWAAFPLPRVPVIVLQARADVWADEERPALMRMLGELGFEGAREALDSELFATGVGAPPSTQALSLRITGNDLALVLAEGTVLETLPGAAVDPLLGQVTEIGGAVFLIGSELGLPEDGDGLLTFEELLPVLLERAIGAFVPLHPGEDAGPPDPIERAAS